MEATYVARVYNYTSKQKLYLDINQLQLAEKTIILSLDIK